MLATDIALSYLAAFSTGDPGLVASHVTADFANNQMGELGACFTGRDLYRERLSGFLSKFRHLKYTPEEIIANGEKVAIAYRMTAEVDGCAVDICGVMTITVSGELISQRNDYWDGLSYLAQTGIV
jgi:ketosteroid isomerase-like protein